MSSRTSVFSFPFFERLVLFRCTLGKMTLKVWALFDALGKEKGYRCFGHLGKGDKLMDAFMLRTIGNVAAPGLLNEFWSNKYEEKGI